MAVSVPALPTGRYMDATTVHKEDPERQELKHLLQADSELSVKLDKIFRIFETKRRTIWGTFLGFREVVQICNENL